MIVQRHIKRNSRARDKGISAADGNERMSLSPVRGLSKGVRLAVVTAVLIVPLIALLIGLSPASPETSNIPDKTKVEARISDPPPENSKRGTSIKIDEPQLIDKGKNYVRHRNPDGSYTIALSSGPMNYYNGTDWDAIDTRIVDRSKAKGNRTISGMVLGEEYRYLMEKADYHAYFPEIFTEAPIRFRAGSHEFCFRTLSVGYACGERSRTKGGNNFISPGNLVVSEAEPTAANPSGNIITYPNVFADGIDVDAEYSLYKTGLKEFWILKSKPKPPEGPDAMLGFNTEISCDSDMYIDGKLFVPGEEPLLTSSEIEFRDKNGETVFRLPRPYAVDANREHVFCTYEIQKIDGEILLKNLVPWSWLDDSERAYPVRVDASPETLSAGFSVVCVGGTSWLTTYISSGYWNNTYRTGIDFDTTIIPDTATITKVELKLYIDEEATPINNDVAKMTSKAKTYYDANNYSDFNSDVDGNEYLSDSAGFAGLGSHTVQLLAAAQTDLQSQLGANWFSVGFTGTTEANNKYRDGHTYLEANPPQIIVTYTYTGPLASISGTITPSVAESAIVSGGRTIIIDLTNDTWVAAGATFDAQRQNIINGLNSSGSDQHGWNNEVRAKQGVAGVVRTSDTTVTITLDAQSAYDITAEETITVTVPASALVTSSDPLVATPTFKITSNVTGYQVQNILTDLSLDTVCGTTQVTLTSAKTIEMIESASASCSGQTKEDKVVFTVATTAETNILTAYFDNGGYAYKTMVTGQSSGNEINFKSKSVGGTYKIYLYNANPSTGALIGNALDTHSETVTANTAHKWTNLSDLQGEISSGNTFAFKMTFTPASATSSQLTTNFGAYGVSGKQLLFNIDETALEPYATISGTIIPYVTKDVIVDGGRTIVITLHNDTWVAAGATFDAQRQNIINGLNSSGSDQFGWNNEVRAKQGVAGVVRTNGTTVTITLDAQSAYDITGDETITVTVPASALVTSTNPLTATPAFYILNSPCLFTYRNKITIPGSKVYGTSNLENFPVLISLTDAHLKHTDYGGHVTNANGWDIIFKASDSTTCNGTAPCTLAHEIESYDPVNGILIAWVKIPVLAYDDAKNTDIYIYYGNSCINAATEEPQNVWNSNYVGVWHLQEDQSGTGTADLYQDSTSNSKHGDDYISATGKTGQIVFGQQFDGSDDYVGMGNVLDYGQNDPMTYSAWIKTSGTSMQIAGKANHTGRYQGVWFYIESGGQLSFYLYDNYLFWTRSKNKVSSSSFNDNQWHYLVATYSGNNDVSGITLYGDGSGLSIGSSANATLGTVNNSYPFNIGATNDGADFRFNGYIDEVRLSNTVRSADWIKTEYTNQYDPGSFYTYVSGNEESGLPTAVKLISFTARGQDSSVLVAWETAQEVSNLGFNLYRMAGANGSYTKLNRNLIPGLISSVKGRCYSYTDSNVVRGDLYYYLLEDVDLSGKATMHGPVCVDWDNDGIPDDQERPDDHGRQAIDDNIEDKGESGSEPGQSPADWSPSPYGESASWVKVSTFKACQEDDGVSLEWATSFEVDNLGFHIYREQDGKYYRVTADLVPGSAFNAGAGKELPGQRYVYFDAMSERTGQESYWLDCVGLDGARASFGPIKPEIEGKPIPERLKARFQSIARHQVSREERLGKILELRKKLRSKEREMQASRAVFSSKTIISQVVPGSIEPRLPPSEAQWALAAKPAKKILVKEEGWYRVGQPELVAAGLSPWVDPRYLQLYVDGEEQSMMVTGSGDGRFDPEDGVEFYGKGLDTPFTDTRVYWLVVGARPGRRLDTPFPDIRTALDMKMLLGRGLRGRGASLSFPYTVELKERTFYFAALKNGEEDSFFGSVVYTEPVNELINAPHPDSSAPDNARLEVVLQGATESSHRVKVLFNNQETGLLAFSGQQRAAIEIEIPHGLILEGENILTLEAQGGDEDASLVDYIRLTYWRAYTADEDSLKLTAMGTEWLSIAGFSSSDIRVVDITDPARMFNVSGSVRPKESDFAITFKAPGHGQRTLLAFSEEKIKEPAGVAANTASSWHERTQGADLVIISSRDFLESIRPLKELREQPGFAVAVVDVEDLYDEFNFGSKSPWPLREFLSRAYDRWVPAPRFVMLVGGASYDPRNYLGFGDFDFVPTKYVETESIKTASDDWFVDFDNDGLPNMAVGRLPVDSAAEAEAVVSKIISYESADCFMNEALLVADANDGIYDFEASSAEVAALLPQGMTVRQILRGQNPEARNELLSSLNQGQLLVNYVGHGSTEIWKGNLLNSSDAGSLTNSPNLPFLVSMTCLNGFFYDPYGDSLAEAFLKVKGGGAVAVWASSGLTYPPEQFPLNLKLIQLLFSGQGLTKELTIGEAVMLSKRAVIDMDVRKTWILFGDPTTRFRFLNL